MPSLPINEYALLMGALLLAALIAVGYPLLESTLAGLLVGVVMGGGELFWKRLESRRKAHAIREGLASALMDLEILLSLQWPFERALSECLLADPKNAFWKWLATEWKSNGNEFFPDVVARLVLKTNDGLVIQALDQLEIAYRSTKRTSTGFGLHPYAVFLLEKQRVARKAAGKKMALVSVLFVMTGSVIPGLLQSFLLVGSAFLDFSVSPEMIFFGLVVGIPALNGLLLLVAVDGQYHTEGI